jgi:hypothetical protein
MTLKNLLHLRMLLLNFTDGFSSSRRAVFRSVIGIQKEHYFHAHKNKPWQLLLEIALRETLIRTPYKMGTRPQLRYEMSVHGVYYLVLLHGSEQDSSYCSVVLFPRVFFSELTASASMGSTAEKKSSHKKLESARGFYVQFRRSGFFLLYKSYLLQKINKRGITNEPSSHWFEADFGVSCFSYLNAWSHLRCSLSSSFIRSM